MALSRKMVNSYQQMRTVGLFGFLGFLPISIAFAQMGLSLLALSYLIENFLIHPIHWPRTPLNRPLFWYLTIVLLTTAFAHNVWKSVRAWDGLFTISAFYLVYLSIKSFDHLKKLLAVLFVCITVAATYGILQHYLEIDPFRLTRPIDLLKHVNDDLTAPVRISGFLSYMTFSGQLAMVIPVLCGYFFIIDSSIKKGLTVVACLITGIALLWTYTRSAWLGMFCALFLFGYARNKKITLLIILTLVVLLLPLYMIEQLEVIDVQTEFVTRILSMFQTKENLERLYTWQNSLDIIKDYPLTGIGKGNFSKVVDHYRIPYGDFEFTSRAHAHNNFLQVAVESGILSLLCFLWLWSVMFRIMYHTYQHIHDEQGMALNMLALGCLGALLAFFVQGCFEHNFGDSEAVMMMWTIMAFGMKLHDMALLSTKH